MTTVRLQLPSHGYDIRIEPGLLHRLGPAIHGVAPHKAAGLLADRAVLRPHANVAAGSLKASGYEVLTCSIDAGEEHKNLHTVAGLYGELADARMERKSPVIALGGGVIGDTAGFVASTYLRGVPFIQCPTTLLAMVDASVGGKVGVNLPQGKNLVGSFYQPHLVAIDTDTLGTLPARELRCGLAECVKHAIIRDESLFTWIDQSLGRIIGLEPEALVELVRRNVQIKANVVMADEKETGERAHLNYGHTFGHAIEVTQGYGHTHDGHRATDDSHGADGYQHGEAVALGMVAATRVAIDAGICPGDLLPRLVALLQKIGLPTHAPDLAPNDTLLDAMRLDKKVAGGRIRLVLPDRMGGAMITNQIPDSLINKAWDSLRKPV